MDFLKLANKTKVTPELLIEVVEDHAKMLADDRTDYTATMIAIFELLKAKGFKGKKHSDMALTINFRLSALDRLLIRKETRGWTFPTSDGAEMVHGNLVRAAALEPLILDDEEQAGFEPEAFRRRVLLLTEAVGQA